MCCSDELLRDVIGMEDGPELGSLIATLNPKVIKRLGEVYEPM